MVKVGLVTRSLTPSPRATPWTKVVLPAPERYPEQHDVAGSQDRGELLAGRASCPRRSRSIVASSRRRHQRLQDAKVGAHDVDDARTAAQRGRRVVGRHAASAPSVTTCPWIAPMPGSKPKTDRAGGVARGSRTNGGATRSELLAEPRPTGRRSRRGVGVRLAGGRHLTTLVTKHSVARRVRPLPDAAGKAAGRSRR